MVRGRGEGELVSEMDACPWCQAGSRAIPFISSMVSPAVSAEVPGVIRSVAIKRYFVHNEKYFFFPCELFTLLG